MVWGGEVFFMLGSGIAASLVLLARAWDSFIAIAAEQRAAVTRMCAVLCCVLGTLGHVSAG